MFNRESLTRIKNDGNGNPRVVIHFLNFLTRAEKCGSRKGVDLYTEALKRGRKLGGKKFSNRQYGGGIVFQSYNDNILIERIQDMVSNLNAKDEAETFNEKYHIGKLIYQQLNKLDRYDVYEIHEFLDSLSFIEEAALRYYNDSLFLTVEEVV